MHMSRYSSAEEGAMLWHVSPRKHFAGDGINKLLGVRLSEQLDFATGVCLKRVYYFGAGLNALPSYMLMLETALHWTTLAKCVHCSTQFQIPDRYM